MLDRLTYSFFKCPYVIRNIVGKLAILAVIPDLLDRIKFRSISRKPFDVDTPGKSPTQSSFCPTVNRPAVENQDNASRKVFQKLRYKCLKIIHPDIAVLDREVQIQTMTFRRNADSRNGRESVSSVPAILNRCLSSWRPGASNGRLKHKTAFINQYGGSAGSTGFFLYESNPCFSTLLWPAHRVLLLVFRASGNSNPAFAESARRAQHGNLRRNVSVSTRQYVAGSTSRFCNHLLWDPLKEAFAALRAVFGTVCTALTEAVCSSVLVVRLFGTHPSSELQSLEMPLPFEPFRRFRGRPRAALPHGTCVARAVFVFLSVSCILLSAITRSLL